jgi:hypothetical protein
MSARYENGVLVENSEEHIALLASETKANASSIAAHDEGIVRSQRNTLLAASDWTQANDSPLAAEKKVEWASYRTALRNLPSNKSWPDVTFPTEPS